MTDVANLSHRECARRAALLSTQSYVVRLDLSRATQAEARTFRSTTTLEFGCHEPGSDTWVDLIAERVHRATLNGRELDLGGYDGARLPVPGLAARNELVVEAEPLLSQTGEGLHRFTDPEDGHTYLYTHFEPTDARRVFACFEQPDLKARFTVELVAPAGWVLRSNSAELSREPVGDGLVQARFAPTPPQSTYLVAVAAGPYATATDEWTVTREDGSTQIVPLMLMCRQSMRPHLETDDLFTVTRQGLTFFDSTFGYPYPWGKYDQVFVPEYNIGAMENPGLVTFTESFLLRGPGTRAQREQRACVVMHEMSHMWFGDLATMRWWDGLWLKESFADLMGYHVCEAATRYTDAWVSFASSRKAWAYRADQLPSTHPVVATVDDLEAARQNFDGITYAKGASVVKQLMAYVGTEQFFAGVRDYLTAHAYGSTEVGDLLDCLERASGRDLGTWAQAWLQTAGLSTLTPLVERGADDVLTRLTVLQEGVDPVTGQEVLRPHRIRIGLYRVQEGRLARTRLLDVDVAGARTEVPLEPGERADLVLLNDDDLTFAKVTFDERSLQVAARHVSDIDSPLSRGLVWSVLWNATRDATLPAHELVDIALAQAPAEPVAASLAQILGHVHTAIGQYVPQEHRYRLSARTVGSCWAGLRAAEPGSDLQYTWATCLAELAAESPAGTHPVRSLLDGGERIEGLTIDDDLRWLLWIALAAQGQAGPGELAGALSRDHSMSGRTACIRARASRPTIADKAAAWRRATGSADLSNDELRSLVLGFSTASGSAITGAYAGEYFASLTRWWRDRTQTMATITASGLFPRPPLGAGETPQTSPAARGAHAWLREHPDAPAALRRIVIEQQDDLERALHAQARSRAVLAGGPG